jgi:PhzF family phenazine biosynthesis protein
MLLSFTTLDVFTSTRYKGNPVAIIRVPVSYKSQLTQSRKQDIGREFNLSEIVFLHEQTSHGEVQIDIFTSYAEVPFAGHPTIGTANYLFQSGRKDVKALITKAGRIKIEFEEKAKGIATLSLPQDFHIHARTWPNELGDVVCPLISIVKGMSFILVKVKDLETLEREATKTLEPKTAASTHLLDEGWQVGIVGTYYYVVLEDNDERVRIRSRMFGTREDPATGSAGSGFSCWFVLQNKKRDVTFEITQGVEMGRQSDIGVKVRKTEDGKGIEEVLLSGTAVKIMDGNIEVE